jgi:DNA-binding ferritin-like protein
MTQIWQQDIVRHIDINQVCWDGSAILPRARSASQQNRSMLDEYLRNIGDALRCALFGARQIWRSYRRAIDETDELGDEDTVDIFIEISWGADKYLWLVEAHLN